jgi:multiple sugar transport system substrate-binding protein
MKRIVIFALFLSLAVYLSGCKQEEAPKNAAEDIVNKEPVTLSLINIVGMPENVFNELIKQPVEKHFSNVTLKLMNPGNGNSFQNMITTGEKPDFIFAANGQMPTITELNLAQDMSPLLKKHNFDTSMFADGVLDGIKALSGNGQLYGVPISVKQAALYYNKDLFDKFGVPYPKDGMTWGQVNEIAKKVARTDAGVQYYGFDMNTNVMTLNNQLSLPFVDQKLQKAVVDNDGWKRWFDTIKPIYSIPGNEFDPKTMGKDQTKLFVKDRRLAMTVSQTLFGDFERAFKENGFNFDLVTVPTFEDRKEVGNQLSSPYFSIPVTSQHSDEAAEVLKYVLSGEMQTLMTRNEGLTVLKDEAIRKQYVQNLESFKGKNIKALTNIKFAPTPYVTEIDGKARNVVVNAFFSVAQGKTDTNTALRDANEKINQLLAEQKK